MSRMPRPASPRQARNTRPRGRPRDHTLPDRRREQILSHATTLFATDGFACADLQRLADQLNVGKGTLYRYFPNKEAMFLAAADRGMRLLRAAVDAAAESTADPLVSIRRAVCAYLTFFRDHPEQSELLIQERAAFRNRTTPTFIQHREANAKRWHTLYQRLIHVNIMRDVPPERITRVLGDLVYGTMFTNYFASRKRAPGAQADELMDVIFHGLLTPQGSQRWSRLRASADAAPAEQLDAPSEP